MTDQGGRRLRSPEGYKIVAGGRSEAQATGWQAGMTAPPMGCQMRLC
jgi:hypothetical protein